MEAKPPTPATLLTLALCAGTFVVAGCFGDDSGERQAALTSESAVSASLESGDLDPVVLKDVRRKGNAEAIVSFDTADLLDQAATKDAGLGKAPTGQLSEELQPGLEELKADVLGDVPGVEVVQDYENLGTSLVEIGSEEDLAALLSDPNVTTVLENARYTANLAESLPLIKQPQAAAAGDRGTGTYAAVLDTGVNYKDPAFGCTAPSTPAGCRVAKVLEAAPQDNQLDAGKHGSNVSGIVAGTAPGAKLLVADIFSNDGYAYSNDTLEAINWVIDQKDAGLKVASLNMSIGAKETYYTATCQSGYTDAFASLRAHGILPVVSAGNSATANGQFHNGVASPACTAGAVRVGAVYDSALGQVGWQNCTDAVTAASKITCFSQSGPILSLLAPGALVSAGGVANYGGTSQAAPHVAGAAAVLAGAVPAATAQQVESALTTTGPSITDSRNQVTRRRLDLPAALAKLRIGPKPTVTAPVAKVNEPLGDTTVPIQFSWTGQDDGGVARYGVQITDNGTAIPVTTNGGGGVCNRLAGAAATNTVCSLTPGHTYQLSVQAFDGAGNSSAVVAGKRFLLSVIQDNKGGVTFSSGWSVTTNADRLFGGTQHSTSTKGSSAVASFAGFHVAWITARGGAHGKATVLLDGASQVVDTQATLGYKRVGFQKALSSNGSHTIKITAVDSGRQVDVDAFVVLKQV